MSNLYPIFDYSENNIDCRPISSLSNLGGELLAFPNKLLGLLGKA